MNRSKMAMIGMMVAGLFCGVGYALAQGSLTPPGAPVYVLGV